MTRILFMDDDAVTRRALSRVLQKEGYEVIQAENGVEGMRLFAEVPADLVITDLFMPEKGGMETLFELHMKYPGVKTILLSAALESAMGHSNLPVMKILEKPVSIPDFLKVVRTILESP